MTLHYFPNFLLTGTALSSWGFEISYLYPGKIVEKENLTSVVLLLLFFRVFICFSNDNNETRNQCQKALFLSLFFFWPIIHKICSSGVSLVYVTQDVVLLFWRIACVCCQDIFSSFLYMYSFSSTQQADLWFIGFIYPNLWLLTGLKRDRI